MRICPMGRAQRINLISTFLRIAAGTAMVWRSISMQAVLPPGDKQDDQAMLQLALAPRGYVAAGINYTLRDEAHPEASVYSQSVEIRDSIPHVIAEAEKAGI